MRVERETWETGGVMATNLPADPVEAEPPASFPYSNWGAVDAVVGVFLAIGAGLIFGIPFAALGQEDGELTTLGNVGFQFAAGLGFLLVPMAIVAWRGVSGWEILSRLGLRRFEREAFGWMVIAAITYLVFAVIYSLLIVQPEQEDIAEAFGPLGVQIALIVILAPVSEEVCFRGMLYGGLRERIPRVPAALAAGIVFGGLHALTGLSAVPPLIFFGFILCLLYEKTGSIVPGMLLHALNNMAALLAQ